MVGVFYTYVWGSHGQQGAPLTFTNRPSRTLAINSSEEGDIVFGVVSRSPADPTVEIAEELKGRVVSAWQISHRMADTAEFGIDATNAWDKNADGSYRWPFALQPIRTWLITSPPEFRSLDGYTNRTHTQRAVTTIQSLDGNLVDTLRALLDDQGQELEVMTPRYHSMAALVTQLRQKHPFALKGYQVQPSTSATYAIYIATLGPGSKTLKIGHTRDASERIREFNKFRLSSERQWELHTNQMIGSLLDTIEVEKFLGNKFARHRTEINNNEVFIDLDPMLVLTTLATLEKPLT